MRIILLLVVLWLISRVFRGPRFHRRPPVHGPRFYAPRAHIHTGPRPGFGPRPGGFGGGRPGGFGGGSRMGGGASRGFGGGPRMGGGGASRGGGGGRFR